MTQWTSRPSETDHPQYIPPADIVVNNPQDIIYPGRSHLCDRVLDTFGWYISGNTVPNTPPTGGNPSSSSHE